MTSLIIDGSTHGLPHAPAYYAMFPREPSPAGNMAFDSKTTTVIKKPMSLELLLETINAPNVQSEVMIVCHAYKDGFYMPLTKSSNDVWADPSAIKLIERADAVARKADVINNLPEITDAERHPK